MFDRDEEFQGELKEGKREGFGLELYPNGKRYEGSFKNDKRSGRGIY